MAQAYYARKAVECIDSHRRVESIIIVILVVRKEPEKKQWSGQWTSKVVVCVDYDLAMLAHRSAHTAARGTSDINVRHVSCIMLRA